MNFGGEYTVVYLRQLDETCLRTLGDSRLGLSEESLNKFSRIDQQFADSVLRQGATLYRIRVLPEWPDHRLRHIVVSNMPESVDEKHPLAHQSQVTGSFRLMFFHKNVGTDNGWLRLRIHTGEGQRFLIRGGIGGPDSDELYVGQVIGRRYWRSRQSGMIVDTSYHKSWIVKTDTVFGGIIDVIPENDDTEFDLTLTFSDSGPDIDPEVLGYLPVYSYEIQEENVLINDPDKIYNMKIGKHTFVASTSDIYEGLYGVEHRYNVFVQYPGSYTLYYTANGGVSAFSALYQDQVLNAYTPSSNPVTDFHFDVPQSLVIRTFPLPGSNYPATLTLRHHSVYTYSHDNRHGN